MNLYALFFGLALFGFCSCDNDDSVTPDPQARQAFESKYPNATQVEWEKKNNYLIAEFIDNQLDGKAWFDATGQWYMTETELTHTSQLPEAIQKALANSEYAQWYIDDIDRLERNGTETIYVIEVKKDKQEYDLYYSADGILVKVQADLTDDDYENYLPDASELPASLQQFINDKYPTCRIIETETEHNRTEVDIIHENRSKEVIFDASGNWLNTHYDVRQNEVETAVMNALKTSAYADYIIDDIERYETPDQTYYLFELEKGAKEIEIKIDLSGKLL